MRIRSTVILDKEEIHAINYGSSFCSGYLIKEPCGTTELNQVHEICSQINVPSSGNITFSRIKSVISAVNKLKNQALKTPIERWKHWNYEEGKNNAILQLDKIIMILNDAKHLLEIIEKDKLNGNKLRPS